MMDNVILDRCCGNCEWSITLDDDKSMIEDAGYDSNESNVPALGDCCLGIDHNGTYLCNNHQYMSDKLKMYAFYDNRDFGQGYYVICKYYESIIKCFKIYRTGKYGNYEYGFIAYDVDSTTSNNTMDIIFNLQVVDDGLSNVLCDFVNSLGNDLIRSYDDEDKEFISTDIYDNYLSIHFHKNIEGKENFNNYINVKIKQNANSKIFNIVEQLYRDLAAITSNMKDEVSVKKVRKIIRMKF